MIHSLRARLLLWVMLPLGAYFAVSAWMSYRAASDTAQLLQDSALLTSARTIIEDVDWVNGALVSDIPPAALEIFESPYQDQVFYKVYTSSGRLLGGTPALADPPQPLGGRRGIQPLFYDTEVNGQPIRAVAYARELYDSGAIERVVVVVGKTEASRLAMLHELLRPQLIRQCLMLALVMILVPLGLAAELRPLIRLRDEVADREAMQLEPLRADTVLPTELRPIVDAINLCIARLDLHVSMQRQFIADAAHQLRTPLTLLDTQIQYAGQADGQNAAQALAAMRRTSRMMTAMTNQLLLLAQAESVTTASVQAEVDLSEIVSSVLEELVVAAQRRDIDLGAELGENLRAPGNAGLLTALVANLVDNAIRYAREGGRVTVTCHRRRETVVLRVIDNGPGIPAEARAHVFERFYRATQQVEGSGLGLPIVRQIVLAHKGHVSLAPGPGRIGLVVTVRLPAWHDRKET